MIIPASPSPVDVTDSRCSGFMIMPGHHSVFVWGFRCSCVEASPVLAYLPWFSGSITRAWLPAHHPTHNLAQTPVVSVILGLPSESVSSSWLWCHCLLQTYGTWLESNSMTACVGVPFSIRNITRYSVIENSRESRNAHSLLKDSILSKARCGLPPFLAICNAIPCASYQQMIRLDSPAGVASRLALVLHINGPALFHGFNEYSSFGLLPPLPLAVDPHETTLLLRLSPG